MGTREGKINLYGMKAEGGALWGKRRYQREEAGSKGQVGTKHKQDAAAHTCHPKARNMRAED